MPSEYEHARQARKGPKITMGQGMHRVEGDKNRMVIEEATPEQVQEEKRRQEIKERGGAYSDRIKIEPKFGAEPRKEPLPSDTEIQKRLSNVQTTT